MPDAIIKGTAANMARAGLAGEALIWHLGGDPRVQRAFVAWRLAHGMLPGAILDEAIFQSVRRYKERDLATLDLVVRQDLGLDYAWLAPLLLFDFGVTIVGKGGVRITPGDVGLPAGRRAKGQGHHIARDVEWFYRAEIKVPRETVYSLAKTYTEQRRRDGASINGVSPSVVQNGIARAKRLLAVLDLEPAI